VNSAAEDVLSDREKRVNLQERLIKRYGMPLLAIRVNYPGIKKENELTSNIIEAIDKAVGNIFKNRLHFKLFRITAEGPIINMIINDKAYYIKRTAMDIEENHILGRCVDIDVYDEFGKCLSREEFGIKPRKCFICENDARNCVRESKHSQVDIISFLVESYEEYEKSLT
jgi:holo-ACP synthase